MVDIERSNSLTDLAARIKSEHDAVSVAICQSVEHAMNAGELLIEAKSQLDHGQWLPWVRDHCHVTERTARRYMRLARNRQMIESNRTSVSDMTINAALALLTVPRDRLEDGMVDAVAETLDASESLTNALRSIAETERRQAIWNNAERNLDAIEKLIEKRPELAELGVESDWSSEEYAAAVMSEDHERAYSIAVRFNELMVELRRLVEA